MIFNLLVAVPAYKSHVHDLHSDSLANMRIAAMMSEVAMQATSRKPAEKYVIPSAQSSAFHWLGRGRADTCDLAFNRNAFIGAAVEMRAHWALMIDADTWQLDPGPAFRMMHDGWARGAAVMAAPVMRRDGVLNVLGEGDSPLTRDDVAGKIQPVRRVGTAFMAVNIPWISEHWPIPKDDGEWSEPWFAFRQTIKNRRPHHISEDFWFCEKVRARGGQVLLDGRFEPRHDGVIYDDDRRFHTIDSGRQVA